MATKLKGTAGNVSMEDFASNLKTIQSQNSGVDQSYTYEGSPEVTTYVPKQPTVSNITTPPVKIPDPITTPTTGNLGMATDSALAGIQANTQVQTEDEKDKAELAKTRDGLLKSIGEQGTQVADAYKDADYIQKKANAVKIQNELTAMEKAYRDETARIKENSQGKLESGINAELNKATDRYNNNRANVSIAYNTALGDFNAAKDAVDLKVQSIKDYNTNYLKTYELIKDSVYNNMTESEKVQANNLQREKEAKANIINATYADVVSNAAQNGAPASVLSAIDAAARDPKATAATITAAAGRYLSDKTTGSEAPKITKINGVDAVWDGEKFVPITVGGAGQDTLRLAQTQGNIQNIDEVLTSPALTSSVGTSFLSRIRGKGLYKLTGDTQNFLAGVQQITSQLSLDSLINAKERGATFGALSEGELKLLSDSATKIDKWAKKDDNGNYTAISTSEKAFKEELDKIKNYAKIDYILRGGKPEDVGVTLMEDGALITKNSDGTPIQLN